MSETASATADIPDDAPAGGVSMILPDPTETAPLYKIMDNNPITISWTYTSLIETPSSLTIDAYCSENGQTYPVSPETGIPGDESEYVWNPARMDERGTGQQHNELPQASYVFRFYDDRGPFEAPSPGLLSPLLNVRFALYSPADYTPLSDGWTCVACNSASSILSPPSPLGFILSFIMISFSIVFYRFRSA